ncbi:MAG: ATP-dependent helicase [Candidatus Pacearchaeota archaeon]|jgi:ATP-dependent Lhr-like helicase
MTQIVQAIRQKSEDIERTLHPFVKEWFFTKFKDFSITQQYGVPAIWERKNILISAPTGGTKTLTAFLSILNYLVILADKNELDNRIYAVYVSPLKALSNDIHKNLIEPLQQINEIAEKHGKKLQEIRVGLRTGDTTIAERTKMAKKAPHILVTTPESLAIVLTSKKFVEYLNAVEFCIIDEIHALDNKRGSYLSLTLERLNDVSSVPPVRIGLSATIAPIEEVAKFLVGIDDFRKVEIALIPLDKKLDIEIVSPVKNLVEDENIMFEMYEVLDKMIQEHVTTLIFTNTRAATERIVNHLKDKFPTKYGDNIAAHHSSLSKDYRFDIEQKLRDGELKVVVCSTSLELGIDIGYIDLVIMLGSPKASSRALQRLGRAGHKLHATAKGRFIVTDRDDMVECAVIQKEMIEKKIDKIHFPTNCLDVLSQQIYGMAISRNWDIDELFNLIRKSYAFSTLSKNDFYDVISYLAGEYALEKNYVYGKIWYDKETKQIGKRGKMARVIYLTNIGTIPEESYITVKLAGSESEKIGYIDEGFLERMKKGDVFVLGGSKYIYMYCKGMNIYVRPALHRNPTIPSWFSEILPLSFDSALEINRFRTVMENRFSAGQKKEEIIELIKEHLYVTNNVAESIYNYFNEQFKFSEIPNSKIILIEKYKGEKNYLLVHSMYGRRVNDALSRALGYLMGQYGGRDIEIGVNDAGFYFAGERLPIEKAIASINQDNLRTVLEEAIEKTDILTRRFRHCAARSLMILRNYKGQNKSVGKQHMKSHFLLAAVKKVSKSFPILKEAKREVLEDLMDIENSKKVIQLIKEELVEIKFRDTKLPSPFALNLIMQGHTDLIKIEDRQAFLKRMHELHVKIIEGE